MAAETTVLSVYAAASSPDLQRLETPSSNPAWTCALRRIKDLVTQLGEGAGVDVLATITNLKEKATDASQVDAQTIFCASLITTPGNPAEA